MNPKGCGGLTCMDGHSGPPASHVHGGDQRPGVVAGVVALHRVQAVPGLRPSNHVHKAVQCAHCRLVPPCGQRGQWGHFGSTQNTLHADNTAYTYGC